MKIRNPAKVTPLGQTLAVAPAACPCCEQEAPFFEASEFNISCNDYFEGARQFEDSGEHVAYNRCGGCGFLFSPVMHQWSIDDYKNRIYNSDYIKTDPPFDYERPARNAQMLSTLFGDHLKTFSMLDYGGGRGTLVDILKKNNLARKAWSFDPFYGDGLPGTLKTYDLITSFEVVEHVPDQHDLFSKMLSLVDNNGIALFSTLLQPDDITDIRMDWWYACPRNGHVSMHTEESLQQVINSFGFKVIHLTKEMHVAYMDSKAPLLDVLLTNKDYLPCPNSPK